MISLAEAKRHIRAFADITTEDDDILEMITEAREWVEDYTGRALVDQTWRMTVDFTGSFLMSPRYPFVADRVIGFRPDEMLLLQRGNQLSLRRSPVIALTRVATISSTGVETELDVDDYVISGAGTRWPRISLATWSGDPMIFEYRAGFANMEVSPQDNPQVVVPKLLKRAMKLIIGHCYEHREPIIVGTISSVLQVTIENLLAGQRTDLGIA